MTTEDNDSVTLSCGNVFADLELPDAEELLVKADLSIAINAILKERKLSRAAAAKLLEIDPSKASGLMRGGLFSFSIDELIHMLGLLGHRVFFTIGPATPVVKPALRGKRPRKAA